jgi:hypothetical protein
VASEAAAVVGLAARDAALREKLYAEAPRPTPARGKRVRARLVAAEDDAEARHAEVTKAAKSAVEGAAGALAIDLPIGSWWAAASRDWIQNKVSEAAAQPGPQREAATFLKDAGADKPRRGYARVDGALWYGVGVPAGEGAGLVLFMPIDSRWARDLKGAAGVEVALSADLKKPVATAPLETLKPAVEVGVKSTVAPASAGKLAPVDLRFGMPFTVLRAPLLFADASAWRAQAVSLAGLRGSHVVLAVPLAPRLEPVVRAQWNGLAGLLGVLILGSIVGLLVRSAGAPVIPEDLLQAAGRIERGEFGARAPALAGKLGVIANALNRAVEAAAAAGAGVPSGTQEFFAKAAAPTATAGVELPLPRPAAEPVPVATSTTSRLDGAGLFGEAFEAAPVRAAGSAPQAARATDLLQGATQAAGEPPEEEHWEQVFQEFMQVRAQCGEPSEGLTFDRFRVKLEKNKEQLVQRYGCRSVRFQVYVKDGKAALKATPVR